MSGWAPSPGPGGPPGPVPGPPPGTKVKPGAWWYWLGGVLVAVGIIGGIGIIVASVVNTFSEVDDFERVDVPGGPIEISEPGDYTIYHEYPGATSSSSRRITGGMTLTDPDGQSVPLELYDSNVNYDTGGHDGVALYSFEAEQAGTYQLQSSEATIGEFAVGEGLGSGLVGGVLVGILFGLGLLVAGIVVLIVTGIRRSKAKRALRPTAPPPGGWGPPPAGAWGSPPPGGAPPPGGPPPPPPPAPPAPPSA